MKIDIEAMALEADPGYQEGLASASIVGKAAITEFARLIVERCAVEAEAQRGTVSMFVSSRDCQNHSDGVKECAAAIRSLLED